MTWPRRRRCRPAISARQPQAIQSQPRISRPGQHYNHTQQLQPNLASSLVSPSYPINPTVPEHTNPFYMNLGVAAPEQASVFTQAALPTFNTQQSGALYHYHTGNENLGASNKLTMPTGVQQFSQLPFHQLYTSEQPSNTEPRNHTGGSFLGIDGNDNGQISLPGDITEVKINVTVKRTDGSNVPATALLLPNFEYSFITRTEADRLGQRQPIAKGAINSYLTPHGYRTPKYFVELDIEPVDLSIYPTTYYTSRTHISVMILDQVDSSLPPILLGNKFLRKAPGSGFRPGLQGPGDINNTIHSMTREPTVGIHSGPPPVNSPGKLAVNKYNLPRYLCLLILIQPL
ncbi:hypothetical protein F4677DRAFT_426357 [Hypoxylon crocopeplum]|nr:hypothetical protein F4677DRAFT_426357 [Hypoxylon crocopeplum]